jgi:pyridoxal phosphate enzyme (YggS family)
MDASLALLIRQNLQHILDQIANAAIGSGRDPGAVRLVVVTKSQPLEVVRMAVEAGARTLGENYAEEAALKIAALKEKSEVEWHMIGHVQSRKADLVARDFNMLHSLDSLKLAARLDKQCLAMQRILPVLLEFNVSGEESKYGLPAWDETRWMDLLPELEPMAQFQSLRVRGLMTMPPFFTDTERSRPYFRRLRQLQEFLMKRLPQLEWQELSMGTSADFMVAVQEGATYVRVGQAILGPRPA